MTLWGATFIAPFYRWETWGTERLRHLTKTTQMVNGEVEIWAQSGVIPLPLAVFRVCQMRSLYKCPHFTCPFPSSAPISPAFPPDIKGERPLLLSKTNPPLCSQSCPLPRTGGGHSREPPLCQCPPSWLALPPAKLEFLPSQMNVSPHFPHQQQCISLQLYFKKNDLKQLSAFVSHVFSPSLSPGPTLVRFWPNVPHTKLPLSRSQWPPCG